MLVLAPNQNVEKYPYTLGKLRQDNPNISFPKNPTNDQLAAFNVFPVERTERPSFNEATQKCKEENPKFQNGKWVQVWSVIALSEQEQNQINQERSTQVRADRDKRLADSDWTQVADTPVDQAAWAVYRQALRDVPQQAGFPWDITWPETP